MVGIWDKLKYEERGAKNEGGCERRSTRDEINDELQMTNDELCAPTTPKAQTQTASN